MQESRARRKTSLFIPFYWVHSVKCFPRSITELNLKAHGDVYSEEVKHVYPWDRKSQDRGRPRVTGVGGIKIHEEHHLTFRGPWSGSKGGRRRSVLSSTIVLHHQLAGGDENQPSQCRQPRGATSSSPRARGLFRKRRH